MIQNTTIAVVGATCEGKLCPNVEAQSRFLYPSFVTFVTHKDLGSSPRALELRSGQLSPLGSSLPGNSLPIHMEQCCEGNH